MGYEDNCLAMVRRHVVTSRVRGAPYFQFDYL